MITKIKAALITLAIMSVLIIPLIAIELGYTLEAMYIVLILIISLTVYRVYDSVLKEIDSDKNKN
jgi:uncharacterized membrane protein YqjE